MLTLGQTRTGYILRRRCAIPTQSPHLLSAVSNPWCLDAVPEKMIADDNSLRDTYHAFRRDRNIATAFKIQTRHLTCPLLDPFQPLSSNGPFSIFPSSSSFTCTTRSVGVSQHSYRSTAVLVAMQSCHTWQGTISFSTRSAFCAPSQRYPAAISTRCYAAPPLSLAFAQKTLASKST